MKIAFLTIAIIATLLLTSIANDLDNINRKMK